LCLPRRWSNPSIDGPSYGGEFGLKADEGNYTMSDATQDQPTFKRAKQEFNEAWQNSRYTRVELPPVDVNRVLRERYTIEPAGTTMTLTQIWDMETKKAWDPATYIPYVVSRGRSWGRHALEEGCEGFHRTSEQVAWINSGRGEVIEDVSVSHVERSIVFLGRSRIIDDQGKTIQAGGFQPRFHVVHGAEGSEERPVNTWRIVVMTEREDDRYRRPFKEMVAAGYLPGFIEVYLRRDMGVRIERH
jgi:hypothetical protein